MVGPRADEVEFQGLDQPLAHFEGRGWHEDLIRAIHPRRRQRMAVVEGGRQALTRYRVRECLREAYSLVEAEPITGRTHQIRVHFASIGHPVVGDRLYGKASTLVGRQFLHAWRLGFRLPKGGRYREFESPLPADLEAALDALRGTAPG